MPDNITPGQFALYWLIDGAVLLLVFAPMGFLIALHKIRRPSVIFFARFLGVFASLFMADLLVMWFAPSVYHAMQVGLANVITRALDLGGAGASSSGTMITLPGGVFKISAGCLGDELVCTYVALVLAERAATIRQYLFGIFGGLIALMCFNITRITVSVYVQSHISLDIHFGFYFVSLFFVLVLWWFWLGRLRPRTGGSVNS